MVKTQVNRFTRVLQFSGNNYFFLKNRKFLQKRGKHRFSAGVSGLTRRPGLCRSASYVKGEVLGKNNIGVKKCRTIFLWVLNFGEVGEILENFQKHPLGESF